MHLLHRISIYQPWQAFSALTEVPTRPYFRVFPEFVGASYMKRYELFCRKLILERHYTSSSFITSASDNGIEGVYNEPANDLSFKIFARSLVSHVGAFV